VRVQPVQVTTLRFQGSQRLDCGASVELDLIAVAPFVAHTLLRPSVLDESFVPVSIVPRERLRSRRWTVCVFNIGVWSDAAMQPTVR
jgi:hypothetical protein